MNKRFIIIGVVLGVKPDCGSNNCRVWGVFDFINENKQTKH